MDDSATEVTDDEAKALLTLLTLAHILSGTLVQTFRNLGTNTAHAIHDDEGEAWTSASTRLKNLPASP
jgi:hypothetical protein